MNYDDLVIGLETRSFGRQLYLFRETDSTNDLALRMGHYGEPEGTLVVAEYQTAGRGRRGKQWLAPPSTSILASLIVRPPSAMASWEPVAAYSETWYTLLTALAIAQSIEQLTRLETGVKWPNDVWIDRQKVCGILTEYAIDQEERPFYVIGFGINVNFTKETIPLPIRRTATALNLLLGFEVPREQLLQRVLLEIENRVLELREQGMEQLMRELYARSIILQHRVRVTTSEKDIEGRACGFDLDGSLLIQQDNQRVIELHAGELHLID